MSIYNRSRSNNSRNNSFCNAIHCFPFILSVTATTAKRAETAHGNSPGGHPVNGPDTGGGVPGPGPGNNPVFGTGNTVWGTNPGINGASARNGVSGNQGTNVMSGKNGGTRNSNPNHPGHRQGSGPWVGLGPRAPTRGNDPTRTNGNVVTSNRNGGHDRGSGTQRTTTIDRNYPRYPNQPVNRDKQGQGSNVNGVYRDINENGAINHAPDVDPGYKPRNYDPVMAFVSTATAAIAVLTLASTILGIFLLHRRQQMTGGYIGKPFGRLVFLQALTYEKCLYLQ